MCDDSVFLVNESLGRSADLKQSVLLTAKSLGSNRSPGQTLLSDSSNASKLFIFKVNYLTWKGNPLKSLRGKVWSGWIGGDLIL